MKKPELLVPAGSLENLKLATDCGADAVYCGGSSFSLRGKIPNFTLKDIQEGVDYAHKHGTKVYITVNIAAYNHDLDEIPAFLEELSQTSVDALIIWDPGVILLAQELIPGVEIHLSTQANTLNWRSVSFWQQVGVKRVGLARELSVNEIREIRSKTDIELEIFIHGAMCIAYSGRCVLSNYLAHVDTHKGLCATPCRWKYSLMAEKKPGEYFPVVEDGKETYILNSRNLCTIEYIPQLVELGIDSLKIEGRQRGPDYISTVARVYREAIDLFFEEPDNYMFNQIWLEELQKLSPRGYTTGFYFGKPIPEDHSYKVR